MKSVPKPCKLVTVLSLSLLCSCATEPSAHRALPADQPINKEAGYGSNLIVTIQLENGRKLPFIVDTGAGGTLLDESLLPKLGKPLGTVTVNAALAGGTSTNNYYAAPKLFLGGAPLMMTGTNVVAWDFRRVSALLGRPVMGILGMDVLEHYCLQLDFAAGKMRFLDDQHAEKSTWGKTFPIVNLSDRDPRPAVAENLFGARDTLSLVDCGFIGDGSLMPKYFQQWTNDAALLAKGEVHSPDGIFGGEKYAMVSLSENDWPSDAIGLNFLARHLVTFDFPSHTLFLQRQSVGPRPDPTLFEYKPIPDREPEVTAHARAIMQDWIGGTEQAGDYTTRAWRDLLIKRKDLQAFTKQTGDIVSLTLVDRSSFIGWRRSYRYRMEFARATVLVHFVFHGRTKLTYGRTEAIDWKEPAN